MQPVTVVCTFNRNVETSSTFGKLETGEAAFDMK